MLAAAPQDTPPRIDEIQRICRIGNAVIRNLEITECYSRLSAAVAARTGRCANWCSFATWASRQAGQTVRGEDLLAGLDQRLRIATDPLHPVRSLWRLLLRKGIFEPRTRAGRFVREIHTPFDAFERASEAVARGNLKVFEEIGFEFARYLAECPPDASPDSAAFGAFAARLRPGDPPHGQQYLREAFARYQRAPFEPDATSRAPLVLLGNLEIGLHEQTRLQEEICEAMDAGVTTAIDLRQRLLAALAPYNWIRRLVSPRPILALVVTVARAFERFSTRLAREVITEALMVIALPGGRVLPLGRHLAEAPPESLRRISDPELMAFLDRFEPRSPAVDDCGASDWSSLNQRLHYIAHLFRAFHERHDLFSPPFTPEQVASFRAGRVPDGRI